jgi:polyisoprenoid-binding protein YceI
MPNRPLPLSSLIVALAAASPCTADTYRIDPVHTRVVFVVDHAGLSRTIGAFSGAQGRLDFDPSNPADARVALTLPLASLELGDAAWRAKVLAGAFLDAEDHPDAHFVSGPVEPAADGTLRIPGTLTLRGTSRPVVLQARVNAVKPHPVTRRASAGFSATATLSRGDFGMVSWPNVIGDRVDLMIEVEAVRDPDATAPEPPG